MRAIVEIFKAGWFSTPGSTEGCLRDNQTVLDNGQVIHQVLLQ